MSRKCPHCAEPFEENKDVSGSGKTPKTRDITVCGNCLSVLMFLEGNDMLKIVIEDLQKFTPEEQTNIGRALGYATQQQMLKNGLIKPPPFDISKLPTDGKEFRDMISRSPEVIVSAPQFAEYGIGVKKG